MNNHKITVKNYSILQMDYHLFQKFTYKEKDLISVFLELKQTNYKKKSGVDKTNLLNCNQLNCKTKKEKR